MAEMRIAYMRYVKTFPGKSTDFGGTISQPTPQAIALIPSQEQIQPGLNTVQVTPAFTGMDSIGYVELAIQARDVSGKWGLSNVATVPIVPLVSPFKVEVLQANKDSALPFLEVGQTFRIRVTDSMASSDSVSLGLFWVSGNGLEILDTANRMATGLYQLPRPFTIRAKVTSLPEGGADMIGVSTQMPGFNGKAGYSLSQPIWTQAALVGIRKGPSRLQKRTVSRGLPARLPYNALGRKAPVNKDGRDPAK